MPKMKHPLRLTRLSDAFVPLALAICALFLEPSISLRLFVGCFAVSALSLFSCFGIRAADRRAVLEGRAGRPAPDRRWFTFEYRTYVL